MNQIAQHPTLSQKNVDAHVDYSEMYRAQEMKQLKKRLRKTRNILLICAASIMAGAAIFWIMPETSFTAKNFFVYFGFAVLLVLLSMYSGKKPYFSILWALIICIAFWGIEIFINNSDDLFVEGSIQKLFIISLLASSLHASREAELIRKELHFS